MLRLSIATAAVVLPFLACSRPAAAPSSTAAKSEPGEQTLTQADIPQGVLDAVTKKYPSAKKVAFSKEAEGTSFVYEVRIADGAKNIEVEVTPEGKIHAEEQEVAFDTLPDAVKKAIASSKYASAKALKAELVVKDEDTSRPLYEVLFQASEKKVEVAFSGDGTISKEEDVTHEN
jgi:hypothetical protein